MKAKLKVAIVDLLKIFELLQRYKYHGMLLLQVQYENTRIKVYNGLSRSSSAFTTPNRSISFVFVLNLVIFVIEYKFWIKLNVSKKSSKYNHFLL